MAGKRASADRPVKVTGRNKLTELLGLAVDVQKKMQAQSGKLGGAIADAVENNHLNKKAFSLISSLYKLGLKDPVKLTFTLDAFDAYRDSVNLDKMKAAKLPGLEGEDADGEEDGEGETGEASPDAPPRAAKGPAETSKDAARRSDKALQALKDKMTPATETGDKVH